MSWRDGSPPRGSADRRAARRDPFVPRDRRGPDCDFIPPSMENPRRPFQRTDQNRRDQDERRTRDRTWKDRDPDRSVRNDRERNRRPDTAAAIGNRERNRRPDSTVSNDRERNRNRETTSSNDREKDRKAGTMPSRKPDVPEKPKVPETTPSNDPEKQKKTEPTPSNVPKKPDPPQSLVQGVVPEHIRRSVYLLKDYLPIKDREPIIGLEYVMEYRVQIREARVEIKYFCELCEMDSGVVPMLDHLCGFKHRKMFVAKEYPFVLKALFSSKEDRALFMRRMAVEIEEEDGIKMYKSDPVVRMVPMMNVKSTEAKKSKRKTRWDPEGERQKKMKQVLKILDSFVIGDDDEAATVTRLLQKVTSVVKFHTDKLKEQALFPIKVARAQNVATTFVKSAIRARLAEQNIFPLLELGNISLHTLGRPYHPNDKKPFSLPNPIPQRIQGAPNFQLNRNPQMPLAQANSDLEIEETDEDIEFFKQLIALLDLLPESPTPTASSKMDSEILMLQSYLLDNANLENAPANQLTQAGPLTQGLASMGKVSPYQQLNRSASIKPAAVAQFSPNLSMPMASVAQSAPLVENTQADQNLLLQMVELIQGRKPNVNASLLEKQNLQNRECIETVNSSAVIMAQTAHRPPFMERQPGFVTASRSNKEFGLEQPMAGKYKSTNKRPFDDAAKSTGFRSNESKRNLFADMSSKSSVYNRDWDEPSYSNIPKKGANRAYDDFRAEQAPLSRVSLPPNIQRLENERLQDIAFERDLRARPNYGGLSSRSFDDPARERDMPFGKRAKLDSDFATPRNTDWGERYPDERGSTDTGIPNLSADLLKKIRGKDLFTVSAILSEYTESNPYN
ncbi:uncharacterized protein LOC143961128 [Lithobates pipiens]